MNRININFINDLLSIKLGSRTLNDFKQFLVLGASAPLAIRGWRSNKDIDCGVINKDIWKLIVEEYPENTFKCLSGDPSLKFGNVDLFLRDPQDDSIYNQEYETIDGINIWTLQGLLKWKLLMNRDKDQSDIQLLQSKGITI